MEGETVDEKKPPFLLQKLETAQILFLGTVVAFCLCPHLILVNKPCNASTTAKSTT